MSLAGQRPDPSRYHVVPRTLTFLTRADRVLLLRVPEMRGPWAGRYNGVGGHLEPGEDPASGARREVREETGLEAESLTLRGVILIDTGQPTGIALYVFHGTCAQGEPKAGLEGEAAWVRLGDLGSVPLVEDLPALLPRVLASPEESPPFSAVYRYDAQGQLTIHFGE